jgi:hypothetical protein
MTATSHLATTLRNVSNELNREAARSVIRQERSAILSRSQLLSDAADRLDMLEELLAMRDGK